MSIEYCLNSVLNQTYSNIEVVVVDDLSTDNSVNIVKNINSDKIRLIVADKKIGAQGARNLGIKNAKGDWIAFLDSDDEFLLDKIEKQVKILIKNNFDKYMVIHSDAILYEVAKNTKRPASIPLVDGQSVYPFLLTRPAPFFQATLTSKQALEEIGYLDENVPSYQEWDSAIRLSKICKYIQMDEPSFIYYLHEGETISKDFRRDIAGYEYVLKKHKKEIIKICGKKVWNEHLLIQLNKCLNWEFYDKAQEYLNKTPISLKRLKLQIKLFKKNGNFLW